MAMGVEKGLMTQHSPPRKSALRGFAKLFSSNAVTVLSVQNNHAINPMSGLVQSLSKPEHIIQAISPRGSLL